MLTLNDEVQLVFISDSQQEPYVRTNTRVHTGCMMYRIGVQILMNCWGLDGCIIYMI